MGGGGVVLVKPMFACAILGSSIVSKCPSNFACATFFSLVNALGFAFATCFLTLQTQILGFHDQWKKK